MKPRFFLRSDKLGRKYSMLTAYDALTSRILEEAKVDFILVGDSVGMVLLGYPNTGSVTMEEMLHHAKAVRRGAPKSFIIGDLPKKGVEKGPRHALESAKKFFHDARLDAVKIECSLDSLKATELIVKTGIMVQGHIGLTPQKVKKAADFKLQGRSASAAQKILRQARAFEAAGASLLLLECIPWELAKVISDSVKIPTIGIGAGPCCDGQVLVFHDLVGMFDSFKPKFVKKYAEIGVEIKKAVADYVRDVREGHFPGIAQSFSMDARELAIFSQQIRCGRDV